jgi:hypothetical protein
MFFITRNDDKLGYNIGHFLSVSDDLGGIEDVRDFWGLLAGGTRLA